MKKFLSVILAVIMVFSSFGVCASAAGTECEHYNSEFIETYYEDEDSYCNTYAHDVWYCYDCKQQYEDVYWVGHYWPTIVEFLKYPGKHGEGRCLFYCDMCGEEYYDAVSACLKPSEEYQVFNLTYKDEISVPIDLFVDPSVEPGIAYEIDCWTDDDSVVELGGVGHVDGIFDIRAIGRGTTTVYVEVYDCINDVRTYDSFEVNVSYTWWQWIIKIVLFGWIWY